MEDELANQELARAILTSSSEPALQGCNVLVAGSLAEARAYLAAGRVDVMLLDVGLPDGDGLDLVAVANTTPWGRTRIIVVSGSVFPMERRQALATGADDFVAKPLEPKDLIRTIVAVLVPRTVLVVEDYAELGDLVREALTVNGYRVLVAPDGKAAIEVAQSEVERIDLLLTDFHMPNMSGSELARRLREQHPDLRVILMSGDPLPAPEAGLPHDHEVLEKPFLVQDLLDKVRESLGRHRAD